MNRLRLIFSVVFFCAFLGAFSLNLTRIDLSHQYDPDAPVKLQYRVTQFGGKYTIHLFAQLDSTSLWSQDFLIQGGYESEDHRDLFPEISVLEESDMVWRGSVTFEPLETENLLIVKWGGDFNFYFDIPLSNGSLPFPSYYPISNANPITTPYLLTQKMDWSDKKAIQVTEYRNSFGPADAPMDEMKALAPRMTEDSVFFLSDSVELKDYKLYYFKNDSLADVGIPLFKTPPYYPRMVKMPELIAPLKYLTTEAEYKTLTRSTRPKKTFDEFWINTYGTKFRARNAIRKYYKGVEYANEYFTTIKEGWKTDQGMILIVYGTPIEMYRSDRGETWIYEDEEFEFIKVSTLFGPVYALRKDKRYEKDWYRMVGDLRRGD